MLCHVRQTVDERDDLGAFRFGDSLVLALDMTSHTDWDDSEPASPAYDNFALSVMRE
jgi:hypothetical protein